MDFIKKHSLLFSSIFSLLFGAIVYVSFFGFKTINPTCIDWIFNNINIDLPQHYLGWVYFKNSPWSFPIGVYDSLSYPIKTSILNTDSLPLFAIFFKLFKNIIPDNFQYMGLFSLLNYMLQSFLGMLIIRKFVKKDNSNNLLEDIIAILCGVIFCLLPILTFKAFYHDTLTMHWAILACFIPIVYKDRFNNLKSHILYYGTLTIITSAIHPYFLLFIGIIIFFYYIYLCFIKQYKYVLLIFLYLLLSFITLYILGYSSEQFYLNSHIIQPGSNLNCFFNSYGILSFFNLKFVDPVEREGFAYFGIGILFLGLITLINIIIKFLKDELNFKKYKKEIIFIFLLVLMAFIVALSPLVVFNDVILFEIPYPDFITKILSVFRAVGRFIWITDYIILTFMLAYFVKNYRKRIVIPMIIFCTIIQLIDLEPLIEEKRALINNIQAYNVQNFYGDEVWNILFKENNIKNIYFDEYIYNHDRNHVYLNYNPTNLTLFLANKTKGKDVKYNGFYFSRTMKGLDEIYFNKLQNPNKEDIFIFLNYMHNTKAIFSPSLKYYYSYMNLIIASAFELRGWKKLEISKEDIMNISNVVDKINN